MHGEPVLSLNGEPSVQVSVRYAVNTCMHGEPAVRYSVSTCMHWEPAVQVSVRYVQLVHVRMGNQ